ncbi:uncharacterized protein LOC130935433 [Arachis stenosperma]|uniref:uncharacterized protein LOC130935433 n=1 Tax=Arachis stenosperma TaxID=217475 RepID=UPI0025AD34BD|nr:uncharacterized protein LOC130935433 [Arachis stenosperma]
MAATMQATAEALENQINNGNNGNNSDEGPMTLSSFLKVHPPTFKGTLNPTDADNWNQVIVRALQAQQPGHLATNFPEKKRCEAGRVQQPGRVYTTSAVGAEGSETLIRGNCEMADKTLNALFDSGATHSFIAFEKAGDIGLKIVILGYDLKVYNATHEAMVTRLGCPQVPFRIQQPDFVHDLICLPMTGLDLLLGLDWLSKNHVLLDFSAKSMCVMPEDTKGPVVANSYYLNSMMVNCYGAECQGILLLTVGVSGDDQSLEQISVVCEFSEAFPDDI